MTTDEIVAELQVETTALRVELDRLKLEHENLIELAYHDPLTGLANRRVFDRELEREWALSKREGPDSFVVIADLNGFKRLNDSLGHSAGDDVLRHFGEALRHAARSTDVVARIGGDEFGLLLVRCDERAVDSFRRRLRDAMQRTLTAHYGTIGVSIGHASLRHAHLPETALDRADLAMLAIKRSDRRHADRVAGP